MKRGMYLPWVRKSATKTSKIASVNSTSIAVFRPVWEDQSAITKVLEQLADEQAELQERNRKKKFAGFPREQHDWWPYFDDQNDFIWGDN